MIPGTTIDRHVACKVQFGYKVKRMSPTERVQFRWNVPIEKLDTEHRQIFGWASTATMKGELVVDSQGDTIDIDTLEKAAYSFALNSRTGSEMHSGLKKARMIESWMATKEKQKALGIDLGREGWWVGFQIDDGDTWAKIKDGTYKDFSIGGIGRRKPMGTATEP